MLRKMSVGEFTYGHNEIKIYEWGEGAQLLIGKFCSIADGLKVFLGGNHNVSRISTFPFGHIFEDIFGHEKMSGHPLSNGDVVIGNDVWIGSNVTIMSGVTIGNGAVIAANSHVVNDVAPFEIIGGNPARGIKMRFSDEIITKLQEIKWWDYPVNTVKKIIPILCSELSDKKIIELQSILEQEN